MKRSLLIPALALAVTTAACSREAAPTAPAAATATAAAAATWVCPVDRASAAQADNRTYGKVLDALNKAYDAALGPDGRHVDQPKVLARLAASRVDDGRMAALAEVSGCAALLDVHASCSQYYDPELGDPLSVFMGMKKSAPLRRQFEAAVGQLRDPERRQAAQECIRRVGGR